MNSIFFFDVIQYILMSVISFNCMDIINVKLWKNKNAQAITWEDHFYFFLHYPCAFNTSHTLQTCLCVFNLVSFFLPRNVNVI